MRLLATTAAIAATLLGASEADRITMQQTGVEMSASTGGGVIKQKDTSGIYNYNEVTYEHIKSFQAKGSVPQNASKIQLGEALEDKRAKAMAERLALAANKKQLEQQKLKAPTWPRFVEGYCYVKNDVEVERIATYAYLSCDFADNGGKGDLVVSLVPDFYAGALIAKPLYITTTEKKTGKKQRVPIVSGAVLTRDRLSINVANIVNDRKIEKITATGAYTTLNVATKQMQAYMADERASRQQNSVTYNTTNGVSQTIQSQTQQAPQKSDYIAAAGIEIVSQLAKVIGEGFVSSLPYTFKINKDSILYVDAELSNQAGVRGYDPNIDGVVRKQPKFDISSGSETEEDLTDIPIRDSRIQTSQSASSAGKPIQNGQQ